MIKKNDKVDFSMNSRQLFYERNLDIVVNEAVERHGYPLESYGVSLFKNMISYSVKYYNDRVIDGVSLEMLKVLRKDMDEYYNSVYDLVNDSLLMDRDNVDEEFLEVVYGDSPRDLDCVMRAMVLGVYVHNELKQKGISNPKVKKRVK